MTYVKTNWENGKTPINAENLNKIEEGIANAVITDSDARVTNVVSRNLLQVTRINKPINQYSSIIFGTYTIEKGKTYTLSFDCNDNSGSVYTHENSGFSYGNINTNGTRRYLTLTATESGTFTDVTLLSANTTVTTPYDLTNIQLEEGSTATPYVPYLNLEEAMKENDIYSTSEVRIGTWIDGKPLYRKVIPFSPDTNSNEMSIAHNISDLGIVINCYGRFQSYSSNRLIPQLYYTLEAQYVISPYSISSTNIVIGYGDWFKTSGNATNCYIILEYTKTTD